jgi:hypothetical protein
LSPNEAPLRHAPDRSLNGREKVVAKNGPFSLSFSQTVALIFAASQRVGWFFVVGSHLVSSVV